MRGRKPQDAKLRRLRGNPGSHPLREAPEAVPGCPPCPPLLGEVGQEEWCRMCGLLLPLGLLTEADMAALALYCQNWERWVEAESPFTFQ